MGKRARNSVTAPALPVIPAKAGIQLLLSPFKTCYSIIMSGWVYLMANRYRGTVYTGMSRDVSKRSWMHRHGRGSAFCRRYGVVRLVYMEECGSISDAIAREKAIKKWLRNWKIELIESMNPNWEDLFERLNG